MPNRDVPPGGGHFITVSDMYNKLESVEEKVDELNTNVALFIQRQEDDRTRLGKLENATDWLKRSVYAIGVPVILLLSGIEAVSRIWQV